MTNNKDIHRFTYKELQERLEAIPNKSHQVLLKTIYAGMARVGEIVRPRYATYKGVGLTNKDVSFTDTSLILLLTTEKRNIERRVPIARIDKPEHEYFKRNESWLTEDIINYPKPVEGRVWDYSTRWAEKRFEEYFPEFGQHIHLLRHWRATHLLTGQATGKPVPMPVVAKMGGWKGTNMLSSTYDSSIIEDYWGEL